MRWKRKLKILRKIGGDSFLPAQNQVSVNGKAGGGISPQHYNLTSNMSSFETVFQVPREALEDPKTSTLFHSPCERDTPDGPSSATMPGAVDQAAEALYRSLWARRFQPSEAHPSTPASVGGRGDRLPGRNLLRGDRHRQTTGNRIYDTI